MVVALLQAHFKPCYISLQFQLKKDLTPSLAVNNFTVILDLYHSSSIKSLLQVTLAQEITGLTALKTKHLATESTQCQKVAEQPFISLTMTKLVDINADLNFSNISFFYNGSLSQKL